MSEIEEEVFKVLREWRFFPVLLYTIALSRDFHSLFQYLSFSRFTHSTIPFAVLAGTPSQTLQTANNH